MNRRSLNMIEAFKLFWQNYFNVKSRTRRRHYWFAILANCIMVTGDASSLNTVGNYDGGHIILDSPDYTFFPIGPSIGIDHENIKDSSEIILNYNNKLDTVLLRSHQSMKSKLPLFSEISLFLLNLVIGLLERLL